MLIQYMKPDILILIETRINSSYIHNLLGRTPFNQFVVVEANVFSEGIWLFWND